MSIEKVRLKNGDEYPVGMAYRVPPTEGMEMDYHIEYDAAATGTGSAGMTITPVGASEPVETINFTLFPFSDRVFTANEISYAKIHATLENVPILGVTPGEVEVEDPVILDSGTMITTYLSQNGITITGDWDNSLPGINGVTKLGTPVLSLVAFSEAGTTTANIEGEMSGTSIVVTATITVPKAGSYWMTTVSDSELAAMGFSAELSFCDYEFDHRFMGSKNVVLNNSFWGILMTSHLDVTPPYQEINTTTLPSLERKLLKAKQFGYNLILSSMTSSFEQAMCVFTDAVSSLVTWTAIGNPTLTIAKVTYNPSGHSLKLYP